MTHNFAESRPSGKRDGPRIPKHELENNATFNSNLVFAPRSPIRRELDAIQEKFINKLKEGPMPEGFKSPIATGKKRGPISRRTAETLLTNLYWMRQRGKSTLAMSLSPKTYSATALSGSGIINLVKLAADPSRGLVILKEGFHSDDMSRLARIKPTREFC